MATTPEVHVGNIGTIFRGTVRDAAGVVDISGASTLQLFFKKPNGQVLTRTATLTTTGTDGQLEYETVAGDLDVSGVWQWQGYVVTSDGAWKTDIKTEQVFPNLS